MQKKEDGDKDKSKSDGAEKKDNGAAKVDGDKKSDSDMKGDSAEKEKKKSTLEDDEVIARYACVRVNYVNHFASLV
jgi:hypothetical protein